jgi:hypothetical protein
MGSRKESDEPGTWTEPPAGTDPRATEQVAADRAVRQWLAAAVLLTSQAGTVPTVAPPRHHWTRRLNGNVGRPLLPMSGSALTAGYYRG